jgi:hypothetical protein
MADYPMPGNNGFTAEDEKQMRQMMASSSGRVVPKPPAPPLPKFDDSYAAMK